MEKSTNLWKTSMPDSNSSSRPTPKSWSFQLRTAHLQLVTISFRTCLRQNGRHSLAIAQEMRLFQMSTSLLKNPQLLIFQRKLTGSLQEVSIPCKTKGSVDHAGPSQLSVLWKADGRSRVATSLTFLSSSLSIALAATATRVATVV
jgi:hypothetical protein